MFESIIKRNEKNYFELISKGKEYYKFTEIQLTVGLPKNLKAFFSAELDWWLIKEKILRNSDNNFPSDVTEIKSIYEELDGLMKKHARLSVKELNAILAISVKSICNYLCRPRLTLSVFVFRGVSHMPFNEIIKRMAFFSDYEYFYNGILAWAAENGVYATDSTLMSVDRFKSLIAEIENDYMIDMNESEFAGLSKSIFDFFSDENGNIPIEPLAVFLDDKNLKPLAASLIKNYKNHDIGFELYYNFLVEYSKGEKDIESIEITDDDPDTDLNEKFANIEYNDTDEIIPDDSDLKKTDDSSIENEEALKGNFEIIGDILSNLDKDKDDSKGNEEK